MAAFRKNLLLTLGLLNLSVDLYSAVPTTQKSGLHRICPEHKARLKLEHICHPGEGEDREAHYVGWNQWSLEGYDAEEDVFRIVKEGDRPSPVKDESLKITPVPAKDLEQKTLDGQTIYYCQPSAGVDTVLETWSLFDKGVQDSKTALVTKGVLKRGGNEKLYRLTHFNNYLVLREVVFPEDIKEPPSVPPAVKISKENQNLFKQLIEMTANDWESLNPHNSQRQAIAEWLKTGEVRENDTPYQNPGATIDKLQQMVKAAKEGKK